MPIETIVICPGYFTCHRPDMPRLFSKEGKEHIDIHKYRDWDHVFWGEPDGPLGRLPMTLLMADAFNAASIIFPIGTAVFEDKTTEVAWFRDYILGCYPALMHDFGGRFAGERFSSQKCFSKWLKEVSFFRDDGYNTQTDLDGTVALIESLLGNEKKLVQLVTSANHLPRVLKYALTAFSRLIEARRVVIGGIAAETYYGGKGPTDIDVYDLGAPTKK